MSDEHKAIGFEGWAIVDLMGHLRMGGYVSEVEFGGARVGRIDVPVEGDEPASTHLFGGQSIYRLTFVDEEIARRVARSNPARPIDHYEITAEIRQRLEAQERERIEAHVRRQVEREQTDAAREERRRVLDILSDAKATAQAAVGALPEGSVEIGVANRLMADIATYCDESHQRLRGEPRASTYSGGGYDDNADDEIRDLPF